MHAGQHRPGDAGEDAGHRDDETPRTARSRAGGGEQRVVEQPQPLVERPVDHGRHRAAMGERGDVEIGAESVERGLDARPPSSTIAAPDAVTTTHSSSARVHVGEDRRLVVEPRHAAPRSRRSRLPPAPVDDHCRSRTRSRSSRTRASVVQSDPARSARSIRSSARSAARSLTMQCYVSFRCVLLIPVARNKNPVTWLNVLMTIRASVGRARSVFIIADWGFNSPQVGYSQKLTQRLSVWYSSYAPLKSSMPLPSKCQMRVATSSSRS